MKNLILLIIAFCTIELSAQQLGTITDIRDGQTYKTVKIGTQWWMAQNTNFKTDSGSYYYNNDSVNYARDYGRLYTWEAAMQCCPTGWHLPSDEEWKQLEIEIGLPHEQADSINMRGTIEGGKLKATGDKYWNAPNTGATDEYGFTALGAGVGAEGNFFAKGDGASFWTSTEGEEDMAWFRSLHSPHSDIHRGFYLKSFTYNVRCVQDDTVDYKPKTLQ